MRGPFSRLKLAITLAATLAAGAAVADSVEGTLTANGKTSKITYVGAVPGDEGHAGGPAIAVVLAEKAPKGAFSLDALREGAQGNYVISTVGTDPLKKVHDEMRHDGTNVGINYGSGGFLDAEGLENEGGTLSGRFYTKEPYDFFGEAKIEADLKFSVAAPK
jgi:hypothetical protein